METYHPSFTTTSFNPEKMITPEVQEIVGYIIASSILLFIVQRIKARFEREQSN